MLPPKEPTLAFLGWWTQFIECQNEYEAPILSRFGNYYETTLANKELEEATTFQECRRLYRSLPRGSNASNAALEKFIRLLREAAESAQTWDDFYEVHQAIIAPCDVYGFGNSATATPREKEILQYSEDLLTTTRSKMRQLEDAVIAEAVEKDVTFQEALSAFRLILRNWNNGTPKKLADDLFEKVLALADTPEKCFEFRQQEGHNQFAWKRIVDKLDALLSERGY